MSKFQSVKVFDGFSTCFRQWRAEGTHCKFLHGYGVSFEVTFEGDLDFRNWVQDFGFLKRSQSQVKCVRWDGTSENLNIKDWLNWLLDHTVIVARNDPYFLDFIQMDQKGIIQLRVLEDVGAEKFAEYLFKVFNENVKVETNGRVKVTQVKFMEHNKNSAIYSE
jgi:6-pyruvoyltetrahydropterin/6-carboxytetrahydropterin synthase